jgi:hypothetical protein
MAEISEPQLDSVQEVHAAEVVVVPAAGVPLQVGRLELEELLLLHAARTAIAEAIPRAMSFEAVMRVSWR